MYLKKLLDYKINFNEYDMYNNNKNGVDKMITFILKKLKSELIHHGKFESGRIFTIISLVINNKKVIFINVHPGHKKGKSKDTLHSIYLSRLQEQLNNITFDRLIIAGDFNLNLQSIKISNIEAINIVDSKIRKQKNTCCNEYRRDNFKNNFKNDFIDNVLDSYYNPNNNIYKLDIEYDEESISGNIRKNIGSDHSPIIATLPFSNSSNQFGGGNDNLKYNEKYWKEIGIMFLKNNDNN